VGSKVGAAVGLAVGAAVGAAVGFCQEHTHQLRLQPHTTILPAEVCLRQWARRWARPWGVRWAWPWAPPWAPRWGTRWGRMWARPWAPVTCTSDQGVRSQRCALNVGRCEGLADRCGRCRGRNERRGLRRLGDALIRHLVAVRCVGRRGRWLAGGAARGRRRRSLYVTAEGKRGPSSGVTFATNLLRSAGWKHPRYSRV
jgi:hypothetical protein